jgi:hypothetical protein
MSCALVLLDGLFLITKCMPLREDTCIVCVVRCAACGQPIRTRSSKALTALWEPQAAKCPSPICPPAGGLTATQANAWCCLEPPWDIAAPEVCQRSVGLGWAPSEDSPNSLPQSSARLELSRPMNGCSTLILRNLGISLVQASPTDLYQFWHIHRQTLADICRC